MRFVVSQQMEHLQESNDQVSKHRPQEWEKKRTWLTILNYIKAVRQKHYMNEHEHLIHGWKPFYLSRTSSVLWSFTYRTFARRFSPHIHAFDLLKSYWMHVHWDRWCISNPHSTFFSLLSVSLSLWVLCSAYPLQALLWWASSISS